MAGYGNKRAPDPTHDENDDSIRFDRHSKGGAYQGGHESLGSGATSGPGFGNKTDPDLNMEEYDNTDFRFDSHGDTAPYRGAEKGYGSGSTGGAGFGNKTGVMESKGEWNIFHRWRRIVCPFITITCHLEINSMKADRLCGASLVVY